MMQSFKRLTIGLAALLLLTVGYSAKAVTLADLISKTYNNGTITSGNLTFSNFTYVDDATFAVPATSIVVTPTTQPFTKNYGLSFTAGWVMSGGTADYNIGYVVTAPSTTLSDYELNMNASLLGSNSSNGNGWISISESVTAPPNITLNSIQTNLKMVNGVTTLNQLSASNTYPLQSTILISKDIYITADSNTTAHLSVINQTYSQVPEPGALTMLIASGICGSLVFLRRRSLA